jgi:hypothetical protein
VRVQLLFFPACPHVDGARRQLRRALAGLQHPPEVTEVDVTDASTPPHLRSWGSPTILVDGIDVAGESASGRSCRLYPRSSEPDVPPLAMIQAALARAEKAGR